MIICTKASQLHLFGVLDLLGVTVAPFHRHFGVRIGVDQDVEGAVAVQNGEEGNGRGDLAEDCLDFVLDLFFGLLDGGCGLGVTVEMDVSLRRMNSVYGSNAPRVLLITRFLSRLAPLVLIEYLNLSIAFVSVAVAVAVVCLGRADVHQTAIVPHALRSLCW